MRTLSFAALLILVAQALSPPWLWAEADGLIASPETGWPQWRGPRRDGISPEKGLLQSWPADGPKLLWKAGKLGRGWSCPIIHEGTIYITGDVEQDLVLFALDLNGKPKWQTTNGRSWTRSYPGARACGTISEGVLYHMNAHGRVAAFDAGTGKERWSVNILQRFGGKNITWGISENLLVDGPRLIVTPAGSTALMAALDKASGKTVWTSEPIPGEKAAYSSPILFRYRGRRMLVNYTNPHAWGVDADTGKLQWKVPLKTRWGAAVSTPVYADGTVFFVAPDGPGASKFRLIGDPPGSRVELAWHSEVDTLTGCCLYLNGRLYANGCKTSKTLHGIDGKTGETLFDMPRLKPRKPGHASNATLWADGRIFGLFEGGQVVLLNPKSDGFELTGKLKLVDARRNDAWAHPVLLDGRLYLRYHNTLWCYDVGAQ